MSIIRRVLDDRHHAHRVTGGLGELTIDDLEEGAVGIYRKLLTAVLPNDVHHAGHRLMAQTGGIDHKGEPGVQHKGLERTILIIFVLGGRKADAVCGAADMEPLSEIMIQLRLLPQEHVVVEQLDLLAHALLITTGDILHGFTHQIAGLEGDDFVGPVFDHLVVDLRANLLLALQDGLLSLVVAPEVINLSGVLLVYFQCLLKNRHHIRSGDLLLVRIDGDATELRVFRTQAGDLTAGIGKHNGPSFQKK